MVILSNLHGAWVYGYMDTWCIRRARVEAGARAGIRTLELSRSGLSAGIIRARDT